MYKKYDEARKMREIYAKEAALEIKKQFWEIYSNGKLGKFNMKPSWIIII